MEIRKPKPYPREKKKARGRSVRVEELKKQKREIV